MKTGKKVAIKAVLAVILLLYPLYILMDWWRLFEFSQWDEYRRNPLVSALKMLTVLLVYIIVLAIGKDGLGRKDTTKLRIIFSIIVCADLAFTFGEYFLGIGLFAVCQSLFIYRNSAEFKKFVWDGGLSKHKTWLMRNAVIIMSVSAVFLLLLFYPVLKGELLFYMISGYAVLLSVSLWSAWASLKTGGFSRRNALLITVGMSLFFLCDFTVGLDLVLQPGLYKIIASSLTWMFYAPALVLLALSGYNYDKGDGAGHGWLGLFH